MTEQIDPARIQRLVDEADLRDLIHRYAFGLDTQDWALWRSIFVDEVLIDMTDFSPLPIPRRIPIEKHVRAVERMFANFEATQHFIGSHRYAIEGDEAVITAHMRAEHWISSGQGGDRYTMYGTYTDKCVRTDEGWRITAVKLALLREEGNRHIMHLATQRPKDSGNTNEGPRT